MPATRFPSLSPVILGLIAFRFLSFISEILINFGNYVCGTEVFYTLRYVDDEQGDTRKRKREKEKERKRGREGDETEGLDVLCVHTRVPKVRHIRIFGQSILQWGMFN